MADQTKLSALTMKTVSGLVNASSNPPMAGPAKLPTLSTVLATTFAALSSRGSRTSDGSSAAWAGRKTVPAIVATTMIA